MTNNIYDTLAERIIDMQYDDDIYDEGSLNDYLLACPTAEGSLEDRLTDTLSLDIKDLLHNGDELIDDETDCRLHDDLDFRLTVSRLIAIKLISRIA